MDEIKSDEFIDMALRMETHGKRTELILDALKKNMKEVTDILIWSEQVCQMNNLQESADSIHKIHVKFLESIDDIGEVIGYMGDDIKDLSGMYVQNLEFFREQLFRLMGENPNVKSGNA